MNLQDLQPSLPITPSLLADRLVGIGQLDLAIDASGSQQRGVQNVDPIRRHDDFDPVRRLEPVQLVQQLHHRALHLVLSAPAFSSRAPDAVDLVHEDQTRLVLASDDPPFLRLPRAHEQFAHHSRALADVLLHQLRPAQADERAVRVVRHGAREQRFPRARRAVEQNALRLLHAQRLEELGVLEGQLDHLFDLRDLLVQTAAHVVGAVRDLLHLHETDDRVHFGGHDLGDFLGVGVQRHAGVRL